MTLGGLAISVGLLVDDAIVDVENVFRRLKQNNQKENPASSLRVVFSASKEVRNSIVFATAVIILSFSPLFFLDGLGGRFFIPLGVSFIVSLIASMLVSLTVTPVLCSYLLPKIKNIKNVEDSKFVEFLKNIDSYIINFVMRKPSLVLVPTLFLLVLSFSLIPKFNFEFLPQFNEGTAMVSVRLTPGISLEKSNEIGRKAENLIMSIPEVKYVSRRTGRAELDEHAEGVNVSEIDIDFHANSTRAKSAVLASIRKVLAENISQAAINIGQPISHRLDHMLSGVNAQIAVKIFGPNRSELKFISNQVLEEMKSVQGLVDTQIEMQVDVPQIKTFFIREDAKKYNVNIGEVTDQLEIALKGKNIAQVIKDQKIINVFSRINSKTRSSIEEMKKIIIKIMPDGEKVTLEKIADVYESSGPNVINRENMQRRMIVQANVAGRGLDKVVAELKQKIEKKVKFPPSYFIKYDGQFKSQQESSKHMFISGGIAFLLIFLLLLNHFKSLFITAQILISIPLAVIGSMFAIYLTNNTCLLYTSPSPRD